MGRTFSFALPTLTVAATLSAMHITAASAAGQDTPVNFWSRLTRGEMFRDVLELRPDGTYTSGICSVSWGASCSDRKATASRTGRYVLRGNTLVLDRGFVRLELDEFGRSRPNPVVREAYTWRIEQGQLYLDAEDGREHRFNEIPHDRRPTWIPRADGKPAGGD